MPQKLDYNRSDAVNYARKWALKRNPAYYDFTNLGGDCSNFISQCLYAGSKIMNYTTTYGWYYISVSNRSPSWTSVNYLSQFLFNNKTKAVFGRIVPLEEGQPGDLIQLQRNNIGFYHSLMITQTNYTNSPDSILICTHTIDSLDRPLSTYEYDNLRCIHIEGVYQ